MEARLGFTRRRVHSAPRVFRGRARELTPSRDFGIEVRGIRDQNGKRFLVERNVFFIVAHRQRREARLGEKSHARFCFSRRDVHETHIVCHLIKPRRVPQKRPALHRESLRRIFHVEGVCGTTRLRVFGTRRLTIFVTNSRGLSGTVGC